MKKQELVTLIMGVLGRKKHFDLIKSSHATEEMAVDIVEALEGYRSTKKQTPKPTPVLMTYHFLYSQVYMGHKAFRKGKKLTWRKLKVMAEKHDGKQQVSVNVVKDGQNNVYTIVD